MDYVDKDELKKEINEKFKNKYGNIQLTYSKFQRFKFLIVDFYEKTR